MCIKNSKVKPKLVEELSQGLSMPLEHIEGSVSSLSINVPWQRLFRLLESEVRVVMTGLRLRSRLRSSLNEEYLLKKRHLSVEAITERLFNPLESISKNSSFINAKLQEYFLNTIVLEVRDVAIEIEVDLKHKVAIILKVDSLVMRRERGKGKEGASKTVLTVQNIGLFYKAAGGKEIELVSPANLTFERIKTEGGLLQRRVSTHNFTVDVLPS
jgi:hypothetical protein